MSFIKFILQDWQSNRGNVKGRVFMLLFRIANFCSTRRMYFYLGCLYIIFYKIFIQWLFTLEVPWNITAGKGLVIFHGQALIINKDVVIGRNCTIRHCTTIGTKQKSDGSVTHAPVIGNNVDVGNNVCIIGPIHIGDNVKIGSGSVVVKDIAADCIVAGNPAIVKGNSNRLLKDSTINIR
ncbi:serine acetyltransferase [Mucilaginibacter glaciei]|uniref:Serine acetyltransferase n=1 Tax=Mucilaginibacter glaciei TaxID=2772109 RepID=A0A926S3V6_9SPHI|nr:serine acetyltransferase [Mucilaginibacter glaciei]MBD1394644.1 serine acetyltransferase [Mucilaginibacter glaciei]